MLLIFHSFKKKIITEYFGIQHFNICKHCSGLKYYLLHIALEAWVVWMVIFSLLNQSRVGPQQGFFCLMLPAPVVPDEVLRLGNKRELCSLIKEWRGESSSSRARALLMGCGRGCFIGTTSWGGVGFSLGSRCMLLRLQLLVWGPESLHMVPQLTCRAAFSH